MTDLPNERIVRIERGTLVGRRPRCCMYNGRMVGPDYIQGHGDTVRDPLVRLVTSGGAEGIGHSRLSREGAEALVGRSLNDLFRLPDGCTEAGRPVDLPLWDLAARMAGLPLYRLLGGRGSREVEVYDGSIYIDDVGKSDEEAVAIYREEVAVGQAHGFRHFKVKVGRGAYWMPTEEGLARDALVIHTVREAAGPDARVLIDANMGNTVNTAIDLLRRTREDRVYWFEEPFYEDRPANERLKAFLREEGLDTLVADGEYHPPDYFFDLVREGLIDVVQHDLRAWGLSWWIATAHRIEPWGARCGPHCWGSLVERYTHAHFAASIPHYALLETSPVEMPGLIEEGWAWQGGRLVVPDAPGIGL
ncbi:MAG: hypothetical protein GX649_19525, partial [Chloroflexi bacterium]|nr:hypothetical protein [Chloroflexota bacterium]